MLPHVSSLFLLIVFDFFLSVPFAQCVHCAPFVLVVPIVPFIPFVYFVPLFPCVPFVIVVLFVPYVSLSYLVLFCLSCSFRPFCSDLLIWLH